MSTADNNPKPGWNIMSVISAAAGVFGFFLPMSAGVLAVITGVAALQEIKISGEKGKFYALIGTALGGISLLIILYGLLKPYLVKII
ncbi:MAG: hypothetical protein A2096_01040 [Spirochaetes bacterium GWF1_41_5]|nr:MAG: hypothetical protein A2096_01040 [Spirochaetes bacterium GWF1_41_5]